MENENYTGNSEQANVDTVATDVNDTTTENKGIENKDSASAEQKKPRMFTQEQVNDFVSRRVERERKSVYTKVLEQLGIKSEDEIESIIAKATSYEAMKEQYDLTIGENSELKRQLLFINKNISDERKDDVIAHFKGKEMELNDENLTQELQTHPEWLNVVKPTENPKPQTTITKLGVDRGYVEADDEKKRAMRLFGFKD